MKLITKTSEPTIKPRLASVGFVPLFLSGTKAVSVSLLQCALVPACIGRWLGVSGSNRLLTKWWCLTDEMHMNVHSKLANARSTLLWENAGPTWFRLYTLFSYLASHLGIWIKCLSSVWQPVQGKKGLPIETTVLPCSRGIWELPPQCLSKLVLAPVTLIIPHYLPDSNC